MTGGEVLDRMLARAADPMLSRREYRDLLRTIRMTFVAQAMTLAAQARRKAVAA